MNANTLISINPADGHVIWKGPISSDADISNANDAAHQALSKWASLSVDDRIKYILKFGQQVEAKKTELTLLISQETGKPLWEAATEVGTVIGKINLSIQAYHERTGEKNIPTSDANNRLSYKPHGVVVVLGAFNFPAHLSNGHIVPALIAGNTIMYKPSELTPAVAAFIVQCWKDAGLPPGVLNLVQGGVECAKQLLQQDIQGVYFTGSYRTGVQINRLFSDRPEVILALEMGGNNPLIIDKMLDIKAAVYYTILSTMLTAGQRCTCARRLMIPDNTMGDEFLKLFITACQTLRVGAYDLIPEPFMGPVISHAHALSHLAAQKDLLASGGKSLLKMTLLAENTGFLSPGIVDMSQVNHPVDEEIFAPLVQVYRYQHFEQALSMANNTRYGLSAGLFSDDPSRYQQFYQNVRAGLINWNRPTTGASGQLPFGGVGRSGNHRPSAYFAADYCAYPIASVEQPNLTMPAKTLAGITL